MMESFLVLRDIGWRDVADVLLLGVLLYALHVIVGRHRVAPFIPVVLVVAAVLVLAGLLDLPISHRLLLAMASSGVLAVLVLFKEEFREFLFRLTSARQGLFGTREPLGFPLKHLALEVFKLAQNRIGALLVFERAEDLAFHLQDGTRLDSRFAPEIIPAVFQLGSPVHDGAMVIRDGHIVWVGTYLPLTHRPDLPKEYGSRHRAAIGLTERSDGVVIVVSEERGVVSVVVGGEAEVVPDPATLTERLRSLLAPSWAGQGVRPRVSALWHLLTGHLGSKLFFLGMALVVWGFLMLPVGQASLAVVPVEVRGLSPGLEAAAVEPETVGLRVRGPRLNLDPDRIRGARVSLPGRHLLAGTYRFPVPPHVVGLPGHVHPTTADPPAVTVRIERTATRRVPVRTQWVRPPPPDLADRYRVAPDRVALQGTSAALEGVAEVLTAPVAPSLVRRDLAVRLPLVLPPGTRLAPGAKPYVSLAVRR